MRDLFVGISLFFVGQTLVWFQGNAQFFWTFAQRHPFIMSTIGGVIASPLFIYAIKYMHKYFDGLLWPGRFIGFGAGIIVFTICTWIFMKEGINVKTMVSLVLTIALLLVQVFWK